MVDVEAVDRLTEEWRGERASELYHRGRSRPDPHWHWSRSKSLAAGWSSRAAACGDLASTPDGRPLVVLCRACGCTHPAVNRCELRNLCQRCARRYWGRTRERVVTALRPVAQELARRGRVARPIRCEPTGWTTASGFGWSCGCRSLPERCAWELRLWTLTVPHSGSLAADLVLLAEGWARLRAWLAARGFRGLRFVRATEVTASDGGHVHYHVVIESPPICFRWMRAQWRRAIRRPYALGVDVQRPRTMRPDAAAKYIATYATKGSDLPVEVAAAWQTASYGRRVVSASVRLLGAPPAARCPESGCGEQGSLGRLALGNRPPLARAPPLDLNAPEQL